jgi:hypothetical protein
MLSMQISKLGKFPRIIAKQKNLGAGYDKKTALPDMTGILFVE